MKIVTLFDRPNDHPESFVGRVFLTTKEGKVIATDKVCICNDLVQLRKWAFSHLNAPVRFPPDPNDHPNVIESWL